MNVRDVATYILLDLQSIRYTLDALVNCIDFDELISVTQELSAEIEKIESTLDLEFELGMNEE